MLFRLLFSLVIILWSPSALSRPTIGMSFPPVKDTQHLSFSLEKLRQLDVVHVRISEDWALREPQRGKFNWAPLERRINVFWDAKIKVLLTVQANGPKWATSKCNSKSCDFKNWQDVEPFLGELLKRVGHKIDAIQFGNEWDEQYVAGTKRYTELQNKFYSFVKARRKNLPVVIGGITSNVLLYQSICLNGATFKSVDIQLKKPIDVNKLLQNDFCNRKKQKHVATLANVKSALRSASYDILDVHLYDLPELWPQLIKVARNFSKKPIFVTEFGGPNPQFEKHDEAYQARRLAIYLKTIKTLPVRRAYYFKLTDDPSSYHSKSGLYTTSGKAKPALTVFSNR